MANEKEEISEKNFIHESSEKPSYPFWAWLAVLLILTLFFLGGNTWYLNRVGGLFNANPFLQVTNRELSLFLWQNPEFMRVNSPLKTGYLPAFQYVDKLTLDIAESDHYTTAPPELLFRYHTWNRLISHEYPMRSIPIQEFRDFISYAEEWRPNYWPDAPSGYVTLVEELPTLNLEDLSTLSLDRLPRSVRIAFQGWKNYFKDKEEINKVSPTKTVMREFLTKYPHYARNYWRNLVIDTTPDYLKSMDVKDDIGNVPDNELTAFLRVAFYNYLKSKEYIKSHSKMD